jgi:U5 snRNP spliceosome subunit
VGTKAERRAAREHVTAYHEARLGELIEYITAAVDRYRAGEIDAYDVDEAIHHYHRAARELWKFCWSGGGGTHTEIIAARPRSDGHRWRIHQLVGRVAPLQRD